MNQKDMGSVDIRKNSEAIREADMKWRRKHSKNIDESLKWKILKKCNKKSLKS